jgi:hypothetical protein
MGINMTSVLHLVTAAGWLQMMTSTLLLSTLATFLIATRRGEYFMVMVPMATVVLMAMVETRVVATMMALMNAVATGHDQALE